MQVTESIIKNLRFLASKTDGEQGVCRCPQSELIAAADALEAALAAAPELKADKTRIAIDLALSVLCRLVANSDSQRDEISDSDLDNEQPIAITFRGQLGDIRNARRAIGMLRGVSYPAFIPAPNLIAHRDALNELVEAEIEHATAKRDRPPNQQSINRAKIRLTRAWEVAEKLAGRKG